MKSTVPSLKNWQASGTYLNVNNQRIFVREEGQGPPLLCLHGFPTSSYDYARLAPLLRDQFHLVFFDFLGYGFSDKPRQHPYSIFEQADITQAVVNSLGIEQINILTHDLGNSVVLELFKRGNPLVERLVMLNGSVLLDYYQPVITQKLLLNLIAGPIISRLRLIRKPIFARQFSKIFAEKPAQEEIDAFWELIQYNDGMANYHLLIQYLRERKIYEHMWLDELKAHTAPLTVIWGQRDPVSVPKIAEAILDRRPDTDYHPLAEVGHFPHWENPPVVANIVKQAFS